MTNFNWYSPFFSPKPLVLSLQAEALVCHLYRYPVSDVPIQEHCLVKSLWAPIPTGTLQAFSAIAVPPQSVASALYLF